MTEHLSPTENRVPTRDGYHSRGVSSSSASRGNYGLFGLIGTLTSTQLNTRSTKQVDACPSPTRRAPAPPTPPASSGRCRKRSHPCRHGLLLCRTPGGAAAETRPDF